MEYLISFAIIVIGLVVLIVGGMILALGSGKTPEEQSMEDEEQTVFLRNYEEERKRNKSK